jgi:pectate lyase
MSRTTLKIADWVSSLPLVLMLAGSSLLAAEKAGLQQDPAPAGRTVSVAVADGFAQGTTGGAGGLAVTVTTADAFKKAATSSSNMVITVSGTLEIGQVKVRSNKTIMGADSNATLKGNLALSGVSNVVIQNLNIGNPSGVGTSDGIEVTSGCSKIFITRCTFTDCKDGSLDIKRASDFVTVSWCRFRYVSQKEHNFANLLGHSDSSKDDRGKLHITMHHNWYDNGSMERMPRVRFGQVHCYNNYYGAADSHYNVGVGVESEILIENCYFDNQKAAWKDYGSKGAQGKIQWRGLHMVNTETPTWAPNSTVFNPSSSYSYNLDPSDSVKAVVLAGAGNR